MTYIVITEEKSLFDTIMELFEGKKIPTIWRRKIDAEIASKELQTSAEHE